jgi:hypothetical protein
VNKDLVLAKKEAEKKDVELRLERERAQTLSEQLKDAQSLCTDFESLVTQNEEVFAKLEDQKTDAAQRGQLQEERIRERCVPTLSLN